MRSTKSTIDALMRFAEARGIRVTRNDKKFVVWTKQIDDCDPIPKPSPRALASLVVVTEMELSKAEWDELRTTQVKYDPGVRRLTLRGTTKYVPDVPFTGLAGWEEHALERLATTELD